MIAVPVTGTDTYVNTGYVDFHEAAGIFPRMDDAAFDELVANIKEHGLLEPIWTLDGKVLDGRHRFWACEKAGVTPTFREWKGDDPIAFVISLNRHRRHLTPSQLGLVAEKVATMRQGERTDLPQSCGMSQAQAAKLVGVSVRQVQLAGKIRREGTPEDVAAVQAGTKTMNAMVKEIKSRNAPVYDDTIAPSEGMRIARTAMGKLNEIRIDDLELEQAQAFCKTWIEAFCCRIQKKPKKAVVRKTLKEIEKSKRRAKAQHGRLARWEEQKADRARMKAMKPGDVTVLCKVCNRIFTSSNPCPDHAAPTTNVAVVPEATS